MPLTPQDFVSKWTRVTAREKQTYQEHCIDLCQLLGHQTPNEDDPTGTRFGFEMGVAKSLKMTQASRRLRELVEQRDRWLNAEKKKMTLTNLYNSRPTWLHLAHKQLDKAVFAAYGWQPDLNDTEILERLLVLNLERSRTAAV